MIVSGPLSKSTSTYFSSKNHTDKHLCNRRAQNMESFVIVINFFLIVGMGISARLFEFL